MFALHEIETHIILIYFENFVALWMGCMITNSFFIDFFNLYGKISCLISLMGVLIATIFSLEKEKQCLNSE